MLILLVAFAVDFGVIRPAIAESFKIPSESMVPTLQVGDQLLVNKFIYDFKEPERGDIVVFDVPWQQDPLIKRVVGLPGDEIQLRQGKLFVNDVPQNEPYVVNQPCIPGLPNTCSYGPVRVPSGDFFAMGDNRANSEDSHFIGPVPEIAGTGPRDPRAVPVPPYGPPPPAPIRVGIVTNPGGLGVHPDVRVAVEAAAEALEDAAYAVEEVDDVPRLADALDAYGRMILTEFSLSWPMVKRLLTEVSSRWIEMFMEERPPVGLDEYVQLTATRYGIQRDWLRFLEDHPLILGPVFTEPPVEAGLEIHGPDEHARVQRAMRLCSATSFVGVPAVAVPSGVAAGLPQGVQVIGGPYREDLCLGAAAAIEERLGTITPMDPHRRDV